MQIAVCRGQNANVYVQRLAGTDALERTFLKDSQQLGLKLQIDLGDFIEQERAAVGRL